MDKIKFLIVAIIAAISFSSCSEDEPAKMLWEVSATPTENESNCKTRLNC